MQNCNIVINKNDLYLEGIINFDNAKRIMLLGCQFIDPLVEININLKNLKASDSSGLAVISAWCRYANIHKKILSIHEMPKFLFDLSLVSGLEKVFTIVSHSNLLGNNEKFV